MIYAAAASVLGWGLDLFDLFIILYIAPVISVLFFPSERPMVSLAATYASFAVTLVLRPLGSAIFGSFADLHGRKRAMLVSVTGVGMTTATFGILPTFPQIGVFASVLFLILRVVQGIFVGGVVASTHTIGVETVPDRWRGAVSGLVSGGGSGIGALLASAVFLVCSWAFPGEQFVVWGWRCMFFSGLLSALLGLFVFRHLEESPFWQALKKSPGAAAKIRTPVRTLLTGEYRKVFLVNLLLSIGGGAGYYLTSGYMPSFLKLVNQLPNAAISGILMAMGVVATFASIAVGFLSDKIGRKRTFLLVGTVRLVALPLLVLGMAQIHDMPLIAVCALIVAFLGNAGHAPLLIFLNERFPTALRATGTGLSWNVGFAIGGMAPTFVSLASSDGAQGIPHALAAFLVAISIVYLIGAAVIPETRGNLR